MATSKAGKVKSAAKSPAKTTVTSRAKTAAKPAARPAAKTSASPATPAAALIDARIAELGDWRGDTLATLRALIKAADPGIVEEWKWSVPVWSHAGIVCTGETYKSTVKLTFARGASIADPKRLFNSSLEGNTRRALDVREGAKIDATAFKALIRAAVAFNQANAKG